MRKRKRKLATRGAGAISVGVVTAAAVTSPAYATYHSTSALANGAHILAFHADEHEVGGGLEYWKEFRTQESAPIIDTVCNWQSFLAEQHPTYGWIFTEYSSVHSGCTWLLAYKDWQNWEANYVEDTRFRGKWISDSTVGSYWQHIGDLID